MATIATAATERASIEAFRRDVIEASLTTPVLVDFQAEWCGPCKTLTPLLERVVASYEGRIKLAKIDIDQNQTIAQQMRIQSVPTVLVAVGGQLMQGFVGAVNETQLRALIDQVLAMTGGAAPAGDEEIKQLVEAGEAALAEGAHEDALAMFAALAEQAPERADVAAGLARALVAAGRPAEALAALDALPPAAAKDAAVASARAAATLAADAGPAGDLQRLRAAAAAAPDDLQAAYDYAGALIGAGERDLAAGALLDIIRRDRGWNEDAARARLLQLFEAVGLADPWTAAQRRKLAAILFA